MIVISNTCRDNSFGINRWEKKTSVHGISGTYLYLSNIMESVLSKETDAGFSMFDKITKIIKPLGLRVYK